MNFVPQMSTALIFAVFDFEKPNLVKQLEVSGMQAICLLAFNDEQEFTYDALKEKTGFTDQELNIQLISLACLDQKVLVAIKPEKKEEATTEVNKDSATEEKKDDPSLSKKKSKMADSKKSFKKTITKEDLFRVNDKFRS